MRKKYWETLTGEKIEYKKIKDNHLINILKFIQKKAVDGVTFACGVGGCGEDEPFYDETTIYGKDVLDYFDYDGLMEENRNRNLIKDK